MTNNEMQLELVALRAELSRTKIDLLNSDARVKRLHIIIGKRSTTAHTDVTGTLTFVEASAIAKHEGRMVQDVLRLGH